MGFQEELDALAQQYQGQPRDPQDDIRQQLYNYLNQQKPYLNQQAPVQEQPAPMERDIASLLQEGKLDLARFGSDPSARPAPQSQDIYSQLPPELIGQILQPQQEQSLREADPIAQISAMLASQGAPVRGDDQVVNSRGSFSRSNPISDSIQNANREAARELATRQAGQGAPLTDEERKERKLEDVMIGTSRDPGLIGGIAGGDPEVMTQLVNSVREITGLDPVKAEELVKKSEGMSGAELLGMLAVGGATFLGGKKLAKGLASKKAGKVKSVPGVKAPKAKPETGSFKTGSDNKAGGYQGTREVGMPERGFQMKGGSSSKAPSGAEIRASRNKQKALPAGEVPKRLEYLMDKKKLTPEELADLKDMFKGVFKQKK